MSLIPLNFLYKRRRRDTTEPVQSPNRPEGRKTTETTPRNLISTGQKVKGPETWNELRSSLGRRHVLRRCRGGIGVPPVLLAVVAVVALVGDDEHRRLAGVALHVLPRRAPPHRAALVVPAAYIYKKSTCTPRMVIDRSEGPGRTGSCLPRVRRALDGLLAVLAPRPQVRGHAAVGHRHLAHHLLQLALLAAPNQSVSICSSVHGNK